MLLLKPILTHPEISNSLGKIIYIFIIILTLVTTVTGIVVFTLLSKRNLNKKTC